MIELVLARVYKSHFVSFDGGGFTTTYLERILGLRQILSRVCVSLSVQKLVELACELCLRLLAKYSWQHEAVSN